MQFKFRANPNYRSARSTEKIMLELFVGLLVVYAFGLYHAAQLGLAGNVVILLVVALACAFATEAIWALATKKKVGSFIRDSYGYITAIILVLTVKPETHPYAIGVCTVLAILFGKLVFGGFGQNIFNPAGIGRAILGTSFAGKVIADVTTGATPVATFASAGWAFTPENFAVYLEDFGGLKNLLIGLYDGAIGETSTILLLVIAIVLAIRKVIDWKIPAVYVGVIFLGGLVIGATNGLGLAYALAFVSTGGVLFGGVFMLTDPVTYPKTGIGRVVYAGLAAIITVLIRLFASLPEGVVFSILIVNMLAPVIDKVFDGKQAGKEGKYNIIAAVYVVVLIALVGLCGSKLEAGEYKSIHALPEFSHGDTVNISATDVRGLNQSLAETEIKSQDGNTFIINAKGFNYEGGKNQYEVVVKDGVIESIKLLKFKDTKNIGDVIDHAGFLGQFKGKGLNDDVDVFAGATYTSYSTIAAAKVALEGAK